MRKAFIATFILILVFLMSACSSNSINGYYERSDGEYGYEFTETEKNKGLFEKYKDGIIVPRESNKRNTNTWELADDVLILNEGKYYFKFYKNYIIAIDEPDEQPHKSDYIAPTGNLFNYEISGFEFFDDGTFIYYPNGKETSYWNGIELPLGERPGVYYRKDNMIYIKYNDDTEYTPAYFIYDGDHIIDAGYVWIKK